MRQLVAVFDDAVFEPLVGVVDALDQRVVHTPLFTDPAASIQIASAGGPYGRRPRVFAFSAVKYLLTVVIEELDDGVVV